MDRHELLISWFPWRNSSYCCSHRNSSILRYKNSANMDFQHTTRLLFGCGRCEYHWAHVQAAATSTIQKWLTGWVTGPLCPDSLFLMLKGQKALFSNNITTPSLLSSLLAAMTTLRHTSNSQCIFTCQFPPSDFFSSFKPITKIPHGSLYHRL